MNDHCAARAHLDFVDGLRALCASYIVVGHSLATPDRDVPGPAIPAWIDQAALYLGLERFAVCCFIVISGFCLMLPVLQAGGRLRGGVGAFLYRRGQRILPPYYASLALTLVAIGIARWHLAREGYPRSDGHFSVTFTDLVTHLGLIQNWSPDWAFTINPPTWTIATESQIYLLFSLLLLPVWRRLGLGAALAAAVAIGAMVPSHAEPYGAWYPSLFVLGMCAASWCWPAGPSSRGAVEGLTAALHRLPWRTIGVAALGLFVVARNHWPGWLYASDGIFLRGVWLRADVLTGVAALAVLMRCSVVLRRAEVDGSRSSIVLRVLSSRLLTGLGRFSYSLYLVHHSVLLCFYAFMRPLNLSPLTQLSLMWGVAVPVTVAVSYGFYRIVEKPFLGGRRSAAAAVADFQRPVPIQPVPVARAPEP